MKISIFAALMTLCYTKPMTDINKVIMEKAQGGAKLNPDEQRRFLGTFEERVLVSCSIEQANDSLIRSHFKEMLSSIMKNCQPVIVKISPEVESGNQIFYLKVLSLVLYILFLLLEYILIVVLLSQAITSLLLLA